MNINNILSLNTPFSSAHDMKMYFVVNFLVTEKAECLMLRELLLLIVLLLLRQGRRVAKKRDGSSILAHYCHFIL